MRHSHLQLHRESCGAAWVGGCVARNVALPISRRRLGCCAGGRGAAGRERACSRILNPWSSAMLCFFVQQPLPAAGAAALQTCARFANHAQVRTCDPATGPAMAACGSICQPAAPRMLTAKFGSDGRTVQVGRRCGGRHAPRRQHPLFPPPGQLISSLPAHQRLASLPTHLLTSLHPQNTRLPLQ